jgi:uncharacterized alkaline shock family protein YloU
VSDLAEALPPAEQRGRLDIHEGVVETIARKAAATVTPTRHASGLNRLTSSDLPQARVAIEGGRIEAALVVAAHWPTPVAALAKRVQEVVVEQLGELTGLAVARVDVEVQCLTPDQQSLGRRVQ